MDVVAFAELEAVAARHGRGSGTGQPATPERQSGARGAKRRRMDNESENKTIQLDSTSIQIAISFFFA